MTTKQTTIDSLFTSVKFAQYKDGTVTAVFSLADGGKYKKSFDDLDSMRKFAAQHNARLSNNKTLN